jgi:hypothetical protein
MASGPATIRDVNTRKRSCVFCGFQGKLDKEHVIADWIGDELPEVGKGTHRRTGAFGVPEAEWRNDAHTSRVGTVCPDCNQGWMSEIENGVRPWLSPVLHGYGFTYFPAGMTTVATWAAKTALVIVSDADSFGREPFVAFFHDRRPSTGTAVWVGSWSLGPEKHYRSRVPVLIDGEPGDPPNAYSVNFTVGHAAFHVFQHWSSQPTHHGFEPPMSTSLLPIWPPPSTPVTWPPSRPLTETDLNTIGNSHGLEVLT